AHRRSRWSLSCAATALNRAGAKSLRGGARLHAAALHRVGAKIPPRRCRDPSWLSAASTFHNAEAQLLTDGKYLLHGQQAHAGHGPAGRRFVAQDLASEREGGKTRNERAVVVLGDQRPG